jgi:hypothetical protein
LDTLIANQTVFPIPMYDSWGGGGSNTHVNISGFVGFQITGYQANGPASSRHIQGRFVRYMCNNGCQAGDSDGNINGSAAVKLRLAARS